MSRKVNVLFPFVFALAVLVSGSSSAAAPTLAWEYVRDGGITLSDYGFGVASNPADGSFVVVGSLNQAGEGLNMLVRKFNSNHTLAWEYIYKGAGGNTREEPRDVAIASNGEIVVTGLQSGPGGFDALTMKFAGNGLNQSGVPGPLWTKTFDTGSDDQGYKAAINPGNGDVAVAGRRALTDWLVIYYDKDGNKAWDDTYSRWNYDIAYDVAFASNGDVIVAGDDESSENGGCYNMLVRRWTATGAPAGGTKVLSYDGGCASAHSLLLDAVGNIYIGGFAYNPSNPGGGSDYIVQKYDSAGTLQWEKFWGYSGIYAGDTAMALAFDANGNVISAGITYNGTDFDWRMIKYDPLGTEAWNIGYAAPAGGEDWAWGMATRPNGNFLVVGWRTDALTSQDLYVQEYHVPPPPPSPCSATIELKEFGPPKQKDGLLDCGSKQEKVEITISIAAACANTTVNFDVVNLGGVTVYSKAIALGNAGFAKETWDGTDGSGVCVPPGMYIVKVSGSVSASKTVGVK